MNERTHFFIKIYLSHLILEMVDVGCVWEVSWRRGQTAKYYPSSSDHSSTFFSSCLGLLNRGSLRAQKPSVCRWLSLRHLVPNWLYLARTASGTWLYNCPTYTCFRCPSLIYTGASLDWRLGRGSICYTRCRSYWKGSLLVALEYSRQLYLLKSNNEC